jgi:hypothetical protein
MNSEEKIEHVKEHLLNDALESMEVHGRYWNGSISRTLAPTLKGLLENSGFPEIHMREISPEWEHVYFMHKDAELVEVIANQRFSIKEKNHDCNESDLPK